MTTSRQGREARTADEILLDAMVTTEIKNVLQDEVLKLGELLARCVYEKIRKRVTLETTRKSTSLEEADSPAKKGKIYHLTDTEEDIRETLRKEVCFRCRKGDHSPSECIFGKKMCYYCNQLGHSYDDCVERMVTKREAVQDPYFPVYDPWKFERIQYK